MLNEKQEIFQREIDAKLEEIWEHLIVPIKSHLLWIDSKVELIQRIETFFDERQKVKDASGESQSSKEKIK